jgi:probable F420-dependent oxidoreductase
MKFVTSLAFSPTEHLCAMARAAEDAGFAALGISDHVVHPEKIATPYPYTADGAPRWPPFTEWPDPWVAIAAMAAVTKTVRFFTSIFVLPMRNPFLVAKAIATAAAIAGDRVALGVGSGWMREEFALMQQPFARRGARMDEMITVLRTLWRGGMVEHHGEFYDFDRLEMTPVPKAPVPIYVGGISERALRRAATIGDGWISDLHSSEELRALLAKLFEYRRAAGRHGGAFDVIASVSDAFDLDGYRRLEAMGVTHLQTFPWIFYGSDGSDLAAKCDGIRRFGEDIVAKM